VSFARALTAKPRQFSAPIRFHVFRLRRFSGSAGQNAGGDFGEGCLTWGSEHYLPQLKMRRTNYSDSPGQWKCKSEIYAHAEDYTDAERACGVNAAPVIPAGIGHFRHHFRHRSSRIIRLDLA
jgi:hypothetical protein